MPIGIRTRATTINAQEVKRMSRESSEAQRRAVRKHDTEMVDKVTVRLPKGTKDHILATGQAVNSFVIKAVADALEKVDTCQNSKDSVE